MGRITVDIGTLYELNGWISQRLTHDVDIDRDRSMGTNPELSYSNMKVCRGKVQDWSLESVSESHHLPH